MPKPSIFSNKYDEQMKKRRRNKIIFIISSVIILLVTFSSIVKNRLFDNNTNKISNESKQIIEEQKNNNINQTKGKNNQDIKNNEKNKEYTIKFDNGKELKILYDVINNEKKYTGITLKNIKYSISPSKKNIVIMEDEVQRIILVDQNGKFKEITKRQYVSSKGETFSKEEIMKANSSYIWCDEPKFLDDDDVVYVSQLPWFNKPYTKYLWKYNISSDTYTNNFSLIGEVEGNNIQYGEFTNDGLEVIVDGVKKLIK